MSASKEQQDRVRECVEWLNAVRAAVPAEETATALTSVLADSERLSEVEELSRRALNLLGAQFTWMRSTYTTDQWEAMQALSAALGQTDATEAGLV